MQRAGHELLAGAGFTVDQHRGVGLGEPADGAEDFLHRRRLPEDLGTDDKLFDRAGLVGALVDGATHQLDRLIHVEGLGQVFECTALKGRDGAVEIRIGGHDDDRHLGKARFTFGESSANPDSPGMRMSDTSTGAAGRRYRARPALRPPYRNLVRNLSRARAFSSTQRIERSSSIQTEFCHSRTKVKRAKVSIDGQGRNGSGLGTTLVHHTSIHQPLPSRAIGR